jgi:hypothetical protein
MAGRASALRLTRRIFANLRFAGSTSGLSLDGFGV